MFSSHPKSWQNHLLQQQMKEWNQKPMLPRIDIIHIHFEKQRSFVEEHSVDKGSPLYKFIKLKL